MNIMNNRTQNSIKQVVIWGHKLHTHTHSYIHYGFYKAFNKLGNLYSFILLNLTAHNKGFA